MKKKKMSTLLFAALVCLGIFGQRAMASTVVTDWSGFNTTDDIAVTQDINATAGEVPSLNSPLAQVINGQNYSLTGASGSYFNVSGSSDLMFKNFGSISDGTSGDYTFSYVDTDGTSTVYKTINASISGFDTHFMYTDSAIGALTLNNDVFANNTTSLINRGNNAKINEINILNSAFYNNISSTSPVIYGSSYPDTGSVTIEDSLFAKNSSTNGNGGTISLYEISTLDISNSKFIENTSKGGGGAIYIYTQDPSSSVKVSITDSLFKDNTTSSSGGGAIYYTPDTQYKDVDFAFDNVTFQGNTSSEGGAIFSVIGHYIVKNSLFE